MQTSWAGAYSRKVSWDLADFRLYLPVLSAVLILQGAGFVLGVGLLFGDMPEQAALFLVTGAPVMNLITAGLIFEPQLVAEQRTRGSYEFLQSLPVPRSAAVLAWYTVALATALPAVALTLATGVARYQLDLTITPMVVPAMLLTCLTGVLMGLAIAHGVTHPMTAQLLATTLIFVMFGFSPVVFPAQQLPGWLAAVNEWLPFGSMATIVRAALTDGVATGVPRGYVVVTAWAVGSGLVVAWARAGPGRADGRADRGRDDGHRTAAGRHLGLHLVAARPPVRRRGLDLHRVHAAGDTRDRGDPGARGLAVRPGPHRVTDGGARAAAVVADGHLDRVRHGPAHRQAAGDQRRRERHDLRGADVLTGVFPISRLPLWLADVHRVLPIYYLGQVLRASLTTGLVSNLALSYAVLAAWTVAAWAGADWVVGRRR